MQSVYPLTFALELLRPKLLVILLSNYKLYLADKAVQLEDEELTPVLVDDDSDEVCEDEDDDSEDESCFSFLSSSG